MAMKKLKKMAKGFVKGAIAPMKMASRVGQKLGDAARISSIKKAGSAALKTQVAKRYAGLSKQGKKK